MRKIIKPQNVKLFWKVLYVHLLMVALISYEFGWIPITVVPDIIQIAIILSMIIAWFIADLSLMVSDFVDITDLAIGKSAVSYIKYSEWFLVAGVLSIMLHQYIELTSYPIFLFIFLISYLNYMLINVFILAFFLKKN